MITLPRTCIRVMIVLSQFLNHHVQVRLIVLLKTFLLYCTEISGWVTRVSRWMKWDTRLQASVSRAGWKCQKEKKKRKHSYQIHSSAVRFDRNSLLAQNHVTSHLVVWTPYHVLCARELSLPTPLHKFPLYLYLPSPFSLSLSCPFG